MGVTLFVVSILLDIIIRNDEVITDYFKTMNRMVIVMLFISVLIMSFTKIMHTFYSEVSDQFTKAIRCILDGGIFIITGFIGSSLILTYIASRLKLVRILSFISSMLDNDFFVSFMGLIISFCIVFIVYSMIENLYIIAKLIVDKLYEVMKNDSKSVYTILIAVFGTIISFIALFN